MDQTRASTNDRSFLFKRITHTTGVKKIAIFSYNRIMGEAHFQLGGHNASQNCPDLGL